MSFRISFAAGIVLCASPAMGDSGTLVYSLNKTYNAVVRIDRIAPRSEAMSAILAMYALQGGSDCRGGSDHMRCALTSALGLGEQCSSKHIALVLKSFSAGLPKMSGYAADMYRGPLDEKRVASICYTTPDSANYQENWSSIRVTSRANAVTVEARGIWGTPDSSGTFGYRTKFAIEGSKVSVRSHKKIPVTTDRR